MIEKDIKSAVVGVMLRIICFIAYYIILILFGIAIIFGGLWLLDFLIFDVFPRAYTFAEILSVVGAIIGVVLFSVMLGVYLVKPLFAFKKNKNEARVEIFENECSELFAMIRDVAKKTGCKMPKHVYLTPDVNACVFYDSSFWSIFFPVKKNLEIGLGLFDDTSVEEVKSVIAHEFGHFSQNSMKVGSTVYVSNTILTDLIYAEDFWDRFLTKLCSGDYGKTISFFGILTRVITNCIKGLTLGVYKFVQKSYLKLSRYMEYDADNISCMCVGTENFVSAMCKIDVLTKRDSLYRELLSNLIKEEKMVSNYFEGKQIASKLIANKELPLFGYEDILTHPVRRFDIIPRVKVEDVWSSHPALEDRLDNARLQNVKLENDKEAMPAWSLIPAAISVKVSNNFTCLIRKNAPKPVLYKSNELFEEWVAKEVEENFMDDRLQAFFNCKVPRFDVQEAIKKVPSESPFTDENALKIAKFSALVYDYNLLNQVQEGQIEVKDVQVDGVIYDKKNLPLEKIRIELELLYSEGAKIYSEICSYVSNRQSDENLKNLLHIGFTGLFYAQDIRNLLLPQLFARKNKLYEELSKDVERDKEKQYYLYADIGECEKHLKNVINSFNFEWPGWIFVDKNYINILKEYVKEEHNPRYSIDVDALKTMFNLIDSLNEMPQVMEKNASDVIYKITKEVVVG